MRESLKAITSMRAEHATRIDNVREELRRQREREARTERLAQEPVVQTMGSAAIGPEPDHTPQPAELQQAPIDIQARRAEKEEQRLTSVA